MVSFLFELLKVLLAAWYSGSRRTRLAIVAAVVLVGAGGILAFFSDIAFKYRNAEAATIGTDVGFAIAVCGGLIALLVYGVQKSKEEVRREQRIEAVEKRVQENPKEPKAAWDLARIKLEDYLNRNLSQVRSIFWLTVLVMTGGFFLIGTGAYESFRDPNFKASVLTSVSGVIVSFIGGTFLVLYKSTMAQAKEYVTMLERINAVGMSVQILETLNDGDKDLKHQTIADVAKQLLLMYSAETPHLRNSAKKRKTQTVES
jgi:predicted membrane metal-binding protein